MAASGEIRDAAASPSIDDSRRRILERVGGDDLTLIRTLGNLGDELIWAGTRRLLSGLRYRELGLAEALRGRGGTALLTGSGGWCGAYHVLPPLLPILEDRYETVIVLPSSFEVAVPEVRSALTGSNALFFARERTSYRQIGELCNADLAHDCAFFFDFDPFRDCAKSDGCLDAFRTDVEAMPGAEIGPGNRDISVECDSLDEWLWTIARHQRVRTDRAHVMIAAALMGKRVEFRPSAYHKLPAIAEFALGEFDVHPMTWPPRRQRRTALTGEAVRARALELGRPPGVALGDGTGARVTVAIATRDRADDLERCLRSVRAATDGGCPVLVVDDASRPETRDRVIELTKAYDEAELLLATDPTGCAGARRLATERSRTPFVFFLDDDAEIFPGTLERLLAALDANPSAVAATATIVLPDGRIHLCGGEFHAQGGVIDYELLGHGVDFTNVLSESDGERRWVSLGATLVRHEALLRHPIDPRMSGYYEDFEWSFRLGRGDPRHFLHVPRALALHHHEPKAPGPPVPAAAAKFAPSIARFYERHGLIIQNLFDLVPELRLQGRPELRRARLFLELMSARGPEWMLVAWGAGELAPLLDPARPTPAAVELGALAASVTELARAQTSVAPVETAAATASTLRGARAEIEALKAQLDALHRSRLWRAADLYWRARRALGSVAKRRGWRSRSDT